MANTCFTSYICTGDERELKDLHQKMIDLQNVTDYHKERGKYGKTWLGNLVTLLGGKIDGEDGVYCRGEWTEVNYDEINNRLNIYTETCWAEMDQWRHFIEKCYKTIKMWYISEEGGACEYCTNDTTGQFFPCRYQIEVDSDEEHFYEEATYEEIKADAESIIGRKLNEDEDIDNALSDWAEENNIEYASYREYVIIDD